MSVRTSICVAALACLAGTAAAGQVRFYEGAGVVTGIGYSTLGWDRPYGHRRIALQAGAFADLASSYLHVELQYLQRGQYWTTGLVDEEGRHLGVAREDMYADYLTLPLLARMPVRIGKVRLFATAGPRLDMLLGYNESPFRGLQYQYLNANDFRRFGFGADWGFGAIIPIGTARLIPEFRAAHTYTDAYRTVFVDIHPSAYQLLVGVRF